MLENFIKINKQWNTSRIRDNKRVEYHYYKLQNLKSPSSKTLFSKKYGRTNGIDRPSSILPVTLSFVVHNFWDDRAFRRAATIERRLYARKMT